MRRHRQQSWRPPQATLVNVKKRKISRIIKSIPTANFVQSEHTGDQASPPERLQKIRVSSSTYNIERGREKQKHVSWNRRTVTTTNLKSELGEHSHIKIQKAGEMPKMFCFYSANHAN